MSDKETQNRSGISGITKEARRYIEKRLELFALSIGEQVSRIVADSIQRLIGILLVTGGLFFAWFALCYYLSDLLGNQALGFLSASIPLLLIGFIFMRIKPNSITRKIQAGILKNFMNSLDQNLYTGKTDGQDKNTEKEKRDG